jgi:phosphocarrier protein HPr
MIEQEIKVINRLGIHARPSSMIVQTAMKFKSSVNLIKDGANADAKSIMSVMMLAAGCDSVVTLRANGPDEKDAITAIASLFEQKFKEE